MQSFKIDRPECSLHNIIFSACGDWCFWSSIWTRAVLWSCAHNGLSDMRSSTIPSLIEMLFPNPALDRKRLLSLVRDLLLTTWLMWRYPTCKICDRLLDQRATSPYFVTCRKLGLELVNSASDTLLDLLKRSLKLQRQLEKPMWGLLLSGNYQNKIEDEKWLCHILS